MQPDSPGRSGFRPPSPVLAAIATVAIVLASHSDVPAQTATGGDPKRVAAYWADWEYWADSAFTHDNVDFSRVTHVNYAFAWNDAEGTLYFTDRVLFDGLGAKSFSGGPGNGPAKCSPPFWHPFSQYDASPHAPVCRSWNDHVSGFTKSVHDHGAKAILSVGGWTLSHRVSEMLASPTARAAFVDNAVALLEDWGFDGLDLDFEYPGYAPHGGRPMDKANYVLLLAALRQRFDAVEASTGRRFELTAAVSCGPQIANDAYDYGAVASLLDYVNLIAYDFGGDWDPVAQHMSPLHRYDGQQNAGFDADSCREFWMTTGQVPPEKLVLGMAHYGRSFRGATAIGEPSGGHDFSHWGNDTETRYYQIADRKETDPTFHTAYDPIAQTHFGWFDGGGFLSFEDETSLAERARYVVDHGLAGVMIWQLRGGLRRQGSGYAYPLLDATLAALGAPSPGEPGTYTIEATAGDGGRIVPSGSIVVTAGATVSFTASADEGYVLAALAVDGETHGGASFTFEDVEEDHEIVATFVATAGGADGPCTPFVQPYAGDPAYVVGDKVLFEGRAWVSTLEPNWWSPSAAPGAWAETSCDDPEGDEGGGDGGAPGEDDGGGEPTGACRPFVQPFAGDAAYAVGDAVLFAGRGFVSTFAPNWWSPAVAPAYWQETTCDDSSDGGEDDETPDGDSPDGACPDFVQPRAGDRPYGVGDEVFFAGRAWVSTFAPNWWSPSAAPQYWAESDC